MTLLKLVALAALGLVSALSPAAAENLDKLKPLMKTTTPPGNGPFPSILMISGCSGFHIKGGSYDEVQNNLTKMGFIVSRVDSLEMRGEKNCAKNIVTKDDQASDINVVAMHLKTQGNIKPDAINVLGWSWGGQGALAAAQSGSAIAKVIAYYPACQRLQGDAPKVPTLILGGEADDVVSLAICRKLFGAEKMVVLRTYPNANHGFDNKKFDPPVKYKFGTLGYNAGAAKSAWAEIEKFLAR